MHSFQDQDTLIEQSHTRVNCIINNHLPPASVFALLGDGKQAKIEGLHAKSIVTRIIKMLNNRC